MYIQRGTAATDSVVAREGNSRVCVAGRGESPHGTPKSCSNDRVERATLLTMRWRRRVWVLLLLASASCRDRVSSSAPRAASSMPSSALSAAVLPPLAHEWHRPTLKVENGPCWVRLTTLDQATLLATESAFVARNPGWEAHVNRLTGLVDQANRTGNNRRVVDDAKLSEEEYHRQALAALRRNADFSGIPDADFNAFQWETGGPVHGRARILCDDPGLRSIAKNQYCWEIGFFFDGDGVVNYYHTWQLGPPAAMCTRPSLSSEQARQAHWIRAKWPPTNLPMGQGGFVGPPRQIGEARLVVDKYNEGGSGEHRTWRLAWAVDINDQEWAFHVDATTGEPVGIVKQLLN
jgi:hypothetical protein